MGMKSAYERIREEWKNADLAKRLTKWKKDPVVKRIERPTRLDRARTLGYKAKQGVVLVRTRIKKGGRHREKIKKGRKPSKSGLRHFTTSLSLQAIAEKRAVKKFPNLEVLNSYYLADDGKYRYYEVILIDPHHPVIKSDKNKAWIAKQRKRAFRGLTSAGKKSR
jgi:large subunit ribosomal protein L15e